MVGVVINQLFHFFVMVFTDCFFFIDVKSGTFNGDRLQCVEKQTQLIKFLFLRLLLALYIDIFTIAYHIHSICIFFIFVIRRNLAYPILHFNVVQKKYYCNIVHRVVIMCGKAIKQTASLK